MKKNIVVSIIFLGIIFACGCAIAENIPINNDYFPDDVFREFITGFDNDGDGVLNTNERSQITEIAFYDNNVKSLQGVEYCSALTYLLCASNQLTSLDFQLFTEQTKVDLIMRNVVAYYRVLTDTSGIPDSRLRSGIK